MLITSCPLATSNGSTNRVAVCHGPKCLQPSMQAYNQKVGKNGDKAHRKRKKASSTEFPEEKSTREKSGINQNLTKCQCKRDGNGTLEPLDEQVKRMKHVAAKGGQDALNKFWRTDNAGDMFGLFMKLKVFDNAGNACGYEDVMDQIQEASNGESNLPTVACRCASCGAWFSEDFKEFSESQLIVRHDGTN